MSAVDAVITFLVALLRAQQRALPLKKTGGTRQLLPFARLFTLWGPTIVVNYVRNTQRLRNAKKEEKRYIILQDYLLFGAHSDNCRQLRS